MILAVRGNPDPGRGRERGDRAGARRRLQGLVGDSRCPAAPLQLCTAVWISYFHQIAYSKDILLDSI